MFYLIQKQVFFQFFFLITYKQFMRAFEDEINDIFETNIKYL